MNIRFQLVQKWILRVKSLETGKGDRYTSQMPKFEICWCCSKGVALMKNSAVALLMLSNTQNQWPVLCMVQGLQPYRFFSSGQREVQWKCIFGQDLLVFDYIDVCSPNKSKSLPSTGTLFVLAIVARLLQEVVDLLPSSVELTIPRFRGDTGLKVWLVVSTFLSFYHLVTYILLCPLTSPSSPRHLCRRWPLFGPSWVILLILLQARLVRVCRYPRSDLSWLRMRELRWVGGGITSVQQFSSQRMGWKGNRYCILGLLE